MPEVHQLPPSEFGVEDTGPYGLFNQVPIPIERGHDRQRIIAVFGGSVAANFWFTERRWRILEETLNAIPELEHVKPVDLNFAFGAYKQPQQLMAASFFISYLGQDVDVVVNIDGFNEIALSWVNQCKGIAPSMPYALNMRAVATRIGATGPSDAAYNLAAHFRLRATRARFASSWLADHLLSRWWLRASHHDGRSGLSAVPLERASAADTRESVIYEAAERWERSSRHLWALATAADAVYVHILQPNQYCDTGRTFTADELSFAFSEAWYEQSAPLGYPLLLEGGRRLSDQGIDFVDATRLFDDVTETVYRDGDCHYTWFGKRMFAEEVAQQVATALRARELAAAAEGRTGPALRETPSGSFIEASDGAPRAGVAALP